LFLITYDLCPLQDGKLPLHLKSEPIPEANDEPLKVVVGDTIQDMVLKSEKNGALSSCIFVIFCFLFSAFSCINMQYHVHWFMDLMSPR